MFFGEDRIPVVREMILASTQQERRRALDKIRPMQKGDFLGVFRAMNGRPVTIRLLDPPLHEFLPEDDAGVESTAKQRGRPVEAVRRAISALHEFNPMLGHRGCRLGISFPEIYEVQAAAIVEAAIEAKREGVDVRPEIMVPLVGFEKELSVLRELIQSVITEVMAEAGTEVPILIGTMIEVPRAAVVAGDIAKVADFFSFGTNDLTQLTLGFSRDDTGKFLDDYMAAGIVKTSPFESLDTIGVGAMIRMAVDQGRKFNPDLKIGICGEHGGDPASIRFCSR
jgi:pyruvate,orthophosphate dikinase